MDKDFFDIFRYNYSIDRELPKEFASKVKLALRLAEVQSQFLEKRGYKKLRRYLIIGMCGFIKKMANSAP